MRTNTVVPLICDATAVYVIIVYCTCTSPTTEVELREGFSMVMQRSGLTISVMVEHSGMESFFDIQGMGHKKVPVSVFILL